MTPFFSNPQCPTWVCCFVALAEAFGCPVSFSLQEWGVRSTCFPQDLFLSNEHRAFAAGTVVLPACDMEWAAWTLCTALFQGAKLIFKVPNACPSGCFYYVASEECFGKIQLLALSLSSSLSSSFLPWILKQGLL